MALATSHWIFQTKHEKTSASTSTVARFVDIDPMDKKRKRREDQKENELAEDAAAEDDEEREPTCVVRSFRFVSVL